jgi:GT2 family glycosyltransferase
MATTDDLAILVLNWNRSNETRRCIESCPAAVRIYVLNNGCAEGEAYRPGDAPDVRVLDSPRNLGFAGGVNLLAAAALADGFVEALRSRAADGIAAVCPMVIDAASGRVWSVGGRWRRRSLRVTSEFHGHRPDAVPDASVEVDLGTGACLLVSGRAIRAIGGLDTTYFAYWEETDWCTRARAAGYRVVTCPSARARHAGGASLPATARLYLMTRNALLFMRRHARRREWLICLPVFFLWTLPAWMARPAMADPAGTMRAVARALAWHARRRIPGPSTALPPAA